MKEYKEYIGTMTSKGQITIPAAVREALGLSAQDKVVFRLTEDSKVEMEPLPMNLEDAFNSVPPINQPEDFDAIHETARTERVERYLNKKENR